MARKRSASGGSLGSTARAVSTAVRTAVSGVRSSCETLATKSLRIALQPPDLGHVHQHHQRPGAVVRPAGCCAPAAGAPAGDRPPPRPRPAAARSGSAHDGVQLRAAHRLQQRPPLQRRAGVYAAGLGDRSTRPPPTAAAPGRRGWPSDRPLGTHHQHALLHRLQDAAPAGRARHAGPARWRSSCRPADPACRPAGRSRRACPGRMRTSRLPSAICRAAPVMACSDRPNTWLVTSDSTMAAPSASTEPTTSSQCSRTSARSSSVSGSAPRTTTCTLLAVWPAWPGTASGDRRCCCAAGPCRCPLARAATTSSRRAWFSTRGRSARATPGIAQHPAVRGDEGHPGRGGRPACPPAGPRPPDRQRPAAGAATSRRPAPGARPGRLGPRRRDRVRATGPGTRRPAPGPRRPAPPCHQQQPAAKPPAHRRRRAHRLSRSGLRCIRRCGDRAGSGTGPRCGCARPARPAA